MKRGADVEILICGAGPVGATLALLLAAHGRQCLLLDTRPVSATLPAATDDPRALALTPGARAILEATGAWALLAREAIGCFERMQVWDECGSGRIGFDSADLCAPALGWIVMQPALQQALDARIAASPGIGVRRGSAAGLELSADQAVLRLDDGGALSARLVVAADGARSPLRALAGIGFPRHAYNQSAVACLVRTALPHGRVARQRFLRDGPLAFLPLAEPDRCGIVWSTAPERAQRLLEMGAADFNAALAGAFEHTLGEVAVSGARRSFALESAHAERYFSGRLVLAGDAAHCVHPLAGQGLNQGLLDAAALAELVVAAGLRGRDPGLARVLRGYERWRRGENMLLGLALDGLQRLFTPADGPLPRLRNIGLDLVDRSAPLKHCIMRRAMGIAGDLPAPARGRFMPASGA